MPIRRIAMPAPLYPRCKRSRRSGRASARLAPGWMNLRPLPGPEGSPNGSVWRPPRLTEPGFFSEEVLRTQVIYPAKI
jgi:hypothetical protein